MKHLLLFMAMMLLVSPAAEAVSEAQDIAATILLRGYDCGGRQVSQISKHTDSRGNQVIQATCPNGTRYQINISADGRVSVTPLR
ncbi:hypothetical protein [Mariprofundus ferrooxydans]|uniref:hypothetical protein n=1 Tax=Mariprofundus ferrooxydans TaxID=314344 RepID=UPI00036DE08B|nr:hypothetical protein [Mariprofundus ferrooxydans]